MRRSFPLIAAALWLCFSCEQKPKSTNNTETLAAKPALNKAPDFNADSAFVQVKNQVDFGPRVPSTTAHKKCGNYLANKLKQYGAEVIEQSFTAQTFDGKSHACRNIIGVINPQATKRILLTAHWDTRPFADQDSKDQNKPIDGANDGGSGVGVLLELARTIQAAQQKPNVGIDIVFFDAEDYGETDGYQPKPNEEAGQWWCIGSRYWANNPHKQGYAAYFGVLLDMVGNKNAKFAKEGASMEFAPSVVNQVWEIGQQLGYTQFNNSVVEAITDDHIAVNRIAKINMIDIIEYDETDGAYFSNTWHTHNDNINNIDKQTLKAVGQTLTQVLYQQ